MKQLFALLTVFFSATMSVMAQDNSLLWKVSGKDLKVDVYLLGTFHMMCEDDFKLPAKTDEIIKSTDQIIFETDIFDPNNVQSVQDEMTKPVPDFLKNFDPEKIHIMDSILVSKQMSIKFFDMMNPAAFIGFLSLHALECSNPTKIKSIEGEIQALGTDKEFNSFEEIQFQVNIIKTLATPEFLYQSIVKMDDSKLLMKEMSTAYNNSDLATIEDILFNRGYMTDGEIELMLHTRNKNWAKEFENKVNNKNSLIAVGAGHLVGEQGLIRLLQDKGYTLTAVK